MPGEAPRLHHGLIKGRKYQFTYQIPGVHRKPREGVAVLIDIDMVPGSHGVNLDFSGRPEFGTTTVKSEWLKSIREVSVSSRCYIDRTVR